MLDKCPNNIIIYATSNTQDLVKFNKRFTTDDIRIDNRAGEEKKLEFLDRQFYDEKRALTDRFGLTLLFAKPDRDIYAQMLLMHAKKAGIDLSDNQTQEELIKKYETWTLYHGTPCGRSAQNFIGYITAKEKMGHLLLSE
jgi:predicted AAA+ superfamily ATPase